MSLRTSWNRWSTASIEPNEFDEEEFRGKFTSVIVIGNENGNEIEIEIENDFVDAETMIDVIRILELRVRVLLFPDVHVVDPCLFELKRKAKFHRSSTGADPRSYIAFSINFAFDDGVCPAEFFSTNSEGKAFEEKIDGEENSSLYFVLIRIGAAAVLLPREYGRSARDLVSS